MRRSSVHSLARCRRGVVVGTTALIVLLQPLAVHVQSPVPLSPVARFFVLADLGERPADPVWQLAPSQIADGQDGYLYTTSTAGGKYGVGTVFKFPVAGDKPPVVLYHFDTIHGAGPQSGLTRGSDGSFYGTTYRGGKYSAGTIFRMTPAGALTVLWDFRNGAVIPAPINRLPTPQEKLDAAGAFPVSAPVELGGTLYGVTAYANNLQYGVVYTIGSSGGYKGLYEFKATEATANGTYAVGLSVGPGGSLWGTTLKGGLGWGTVYQVAGGGVSVIHKFDAASAGSMGVIQGEDGRLYGASTGPTTSFGRVYRLDPLSGTFAVIHCFDGADGSIPQAAPTQGTDGMLYGVTKAGGKAGRGVIYRLNPNPSDNHCVDPANHPNKVEDFSVVFTFDMNDGRYAQSPLIEHTTPGSKGIDFYGVTYQGGTRDAGVAYRVNVRMYPKPASDAIFQFGTRMSTDSMLILAKGVNAYQGTLNLAGLKASDGVSIQLLCPRDPHIVQFVMRTGMLADGTPVTGTYAATWGTVPSPTPGVFLKEFNRWNTDAIGHPNGYYDQSPGSAHRNDLTSVTIFDAPNDTAVLTPRGWLITARDFAICNGKVVRHATWSKGAAWDAVKGQLGPAVYTNFQVFAPAATDDPTAWSNTQLQWINEHLTADGYDPVP